MMAWHGLWKPLAARPRLNLTRRCKVYRAESLEGRRLLSAGGVLGRMHPYAELDEAPETYEAADEYERGATALHGDVSRTDYSSTQRLDSSGGAQRPESTAYAYVAANRGEAVLGSLLVPHPAHPALGIVALSSQSGTADGRPSQEFVASGLRSLTQVKFDLQRLSESSSPLSGSTSRLGTAISVDLGADRIKAARSGQDQESLRTGAGLTRDFELPSGARPQLADVEHRFAEFADELMDRYAQQGPARLENAMDFEGMIEWGPADDELDLPHKAAESVTNEWAEQFRADDRLPSHPTDAGPPVQGMANGLRARDGVVWSPQEAGLIELSTSAEGWPDQQATAHQSTPAESNLVPSVGLYQAFDLAEPPEAAFNAQRAAGMSARTSGRRSSEAEADTGSTAPDQTMLLPTRSALLLPALMGLRTFRARAKEEGSRRKQRPE